MKHKSTRSVYLILAALILLLIISGCIKEEEVGWPRWRGPNGDGISTETDWDPKALADGPKIVWRLDIGGGLPSTYANTNAKVFDSIYKRIKEIKVWLNNKNIKLMIEPGRFICAPSVKLITYVKAVYENNIIVDASVYNSDTDAFTVPTKLLVENELDIKTKNAKPFVIKGFTPCSMDLFRYRVYLKKPNVGDIITFINAGAYNFYCDFCDLEKLPTKIIDTFED